MPAPDPIPFDEDPRGHGAGGARRIAEVLEDRGVDATADLFDEAVELARGGQLNKARDRLRMLLCLDPHDGQAHLLLAKVFVAQKRWQDAIAQLDATSACGVRLPPGLRESVAASRDASSRSSRDDKVMAATRGELHTLRDEARRLRAENTRLERSVRELTDKARLWMSATSVVGVVCILALLGSVLVGDDPAEVSTAEEPPAEVIAPVVEVAPEPAEAPVAVEPAVPRIYVVSKGDNLSVVSQKVYGTSNRWEQIRDANEDLLHGSNALQVGMELFIPD
ncbi:MAG TPA: tetratricopeptide repeat protein [Myxococcota bacterium]|nr:tetratricopeptide repeat protein [Myxococcota bacterium]